MGNCSTNTTNFVNNVNEPVKDEEEEIFDANAGQNGSAAICLQNDEQKIDTHDIKDEENVVCEEEIVNSLKNNEDNLQESKFNVNFSEKEERLYTEFSGKPNICSHLKMFLVEQKKYFVKSTYCRIF